jgi:ABC-type sugar transport system ATPase subunit
VTGRTGQTGVAGVTVTRDGSAVLRDVTLLAGDGELLVVLGSSGSGKSTLLRVTGRARQLRMSRLLPRRPDQLSEGERGLVGIGRALVRVCRIVEVVRSLHATTFYVTTTRPRHWPSRTGWRCCTRARCCRSAIRWTLYERPVDMVVCGFVGSPPVGLLPARLLPARLFDRRERRAAA